MYRGLHDNIEHLPLAGLRIDLLVVAALHPENNLKGMRDDNVTLLVLVREVKLVAGLRQRNILRYRPWSGTHELRDDFGKIVVGINCAVQGRVLECFYVIRVERKKRVFFMRILQRQKHDTVHWIRTDQALEVRVVLDTLCRSSEKKIHELINGQRTFDD